MNGFPQMVLREGSDGFPAVSPSVDLAAAFLLGLLVMILFTGVFFVWLISFYTRRRQFYSPGLAPVIQPWAGERFLPGVLEPPNCWLALQTCDLRAVRAALNVRRAVSCSWEEGLAEARENKLFISPPLNGWVIVMGACLPDPAEDVDACFHFLASLSRKLGRVEFFSANRVLHHHAWAQMEQGRVVRAYAWAGQTLWNQGQLTTAEVELGMRCSDYAEPEMDGDFSPTELAAWNTERIPLLAARWSVDPAAITMRHPHLGRGIAGESAA